MACTGRRVRVQAIEAEARAGLQGRETEGARRARQEWRAGTGQ